MKAVPETAFEVHVMALQSVFPSINGSRLTNGFSAEARFHVDGVYEMDCRLESSYEEEVVKGFTESLDFADGSDVKATVRRFVFQKASTCEETDEGNPTFD